MLDCLPHYSSRVSWHGTITEPGLDLTGPYSNKHQGRELYLSNSSNSAFARDCSQRSKKERERERARERRPLVSQICRNAYDSVNNFQRHVMATGSVGESRDMSKVPHRRGDMTKSSIAVYKPKKLQRYAIYLPLKCNMKLV